MSLPPIDQFIVAIAGQKEELRVDVTKDVTKNRRLWAAVFKLLKNFQKNDKLKSEEIFNGAISVVVSHCNLWSCQEEFESPMAPFLKIKNALRKR